MTPIEAICADIQAIQGTIGAFVWHRSRCLASSLPRSYDPTRLAEIGDRLWRLMHLARAADYDGSPSILCWRQSSLWAWSVGEGGLLVVVASSAASRTLLGFGATLATPTVAQLLNEATAGSRSGHVPPFDAHAERPEASTRELAKLVRLERMLTAEVGLAGRDLLEQSVRQALATVPPAGAWLSQIRELVLAAIPDESTRTRVGKSPWWD